jgi:FkbM family methyltransferase
MSALKNILPPKVYTTLLDAYQTYISGYYRKAYSQEGEDLLLSRIFGKKNNGFYVDVGALHPLRFSNTYYFYKQGWQGINIEPRPGSKLLFDKARPKDINLENGVSNEEKTLTYHIFNEPALNTFSEEVALRNSKVSGYAVQKKVSIKTVTLKSVFDRYLKEGQNIDFLSIDVEGLDFEVLQSNDWGKYKPSVILVEDTQFNFLNIKASQVYNYLSGNGYNFYAKTVNTLFFKLDEFIVL